MTKDELEAENAELKERLLKVENAYKRKSEAEWRLNDLYQKMRTDYANAEKCSREYFTRYRDVLDLLIKAEKIIKKLSCTYKYVIQFEEYADREVLTEAEKFLKEVSEFEN